jgi:hypothetical protein
VDVNVEIISANLLENTKRKWRVTPAIFND